MRLRIAGLVLLAGLTCVPMAWADQVADDIDKATAAWRAHDSQHTLDALESATALLRQARADALKALLPLPPTGWTTDAPETTAVSGDVLGGGTSASETYHNGPQRVQVQITTDNPMLQGMAALIDSPLAGSAGVKPEKIAGRSVAYTQSDNGYMTLIGEKIIVKVNGNKDTPEATLRTFVAAIDFDALRKLTQ